jgi:hypothetical protein
VTPSCQPSERLVANTSGHLEQRAAAAIAPAPPLRQIALEPRGAGVRGPVRLDGAEPSALDHRAGPAHERVLPEVEADGGPDGRAARALDEAVGVVERQRQRLLDEEMPARVEDRERDLAVEGGGHAHGHGVE